MLTGHALALVGTAEDIPALLAFLQTEGVRTAGNGDLYVRRYGSFTIDDARRLIERASLRGIAGRRVFVLVVDVIQTEAQHALLKTIEEPRGGALFVFLHPSPETLLPTLRSRMQIIALPGRRAAVSGVDVAGFLAASCAKRLVMLKTLLEQDGDAPEADGSQRSTAGKRDMGDMLHFLTELERMLGADASRRDALHAVYRARRYIGDRGALVKPLLEQVALLV